jgi:hypothetical protein
MARIIIPRSGNSVNFDPAQTLALRVQKLMEAGQRPAPPGVDWRARVPRKRTGSGLEARAPRGRLEAGVPGDVDEGVIRGRNPGVQFGWWLFAL